MKEFELLSDILQKIYEEEKTGTLRIEKSDNEAYIYFLKGYIRSLSYSKKHSLLAAGLKKCLEMDRRTLEEIFAQQRQQKRSFLQLFLAAPVDETFKQTSFLVSVCKREIEENLYDILAWENVHCEFTDHLLDKKVFDAQLVELPIQLHPQAIAVEFARRCDEWALLERNFPSPKDIPCLIVEEEIKSQQHSEEETYVLEMINGIRDLDELLQEVPLYPFSAYKTLNRLYLQQKIRLRSAQELKQLAELDPLKENLFKRIRLYERYEELEGESLESMIWLARAYEMGELKNKAAEKYRQLGKKSFEENQYESAVKAYRQVIELAPEDLEAHEKLIQACNKHGDLEKAAEVSARYARKISVSDKRKAIMVLDEANKNFPSSLSNLELMANLYLEMGDKSNAISTCNILAILMKKQHKPELTLDVYRKIIQIDPDNIQARIELGDGLIESGQQQQGVEEYKKLGELLHNRLEKSQAISDSLIAVCECIIQFEQDSVMARSWLVNAYIRKNNPQKAIAVLEKLIELCLEQKDWQTLVSNLTKLKDLAPQDFARRKLLAESLLRIGQRSQAIEEYVALGLATYEKNDMRRAKEAFEALLEIDPFNLTARKKYAEILRHLNRQARAVEEYKVVAFLSKSIQKYQDAIHAFSAILDLTAEKELWAFSEIAELYELERDYRRAIENHRVYAMKNYLRGNYGEALGVCQRVLALAPTDAPSEDLKNRAQEKLQRFSQLRSSG